MSEQEIQPSAVVKVARDLTEITALHEALLTQAVAQGDAKSMPGGRAMVALGNVASMEAWENMQQATERYGVGYTSAADEDPDESWSAFQLLRFWSEAWRIEHGANYDVKPTIVTEAGYLRYLLNWAWENEMHWDEFAADVRRARVRLEDVLHAGQRQELSRIVCSECIAAPRLIVLRGQTDDAWKCPACKHRYDSDAVQRAHAKMLRSQGAERWLHQTDAIATLKAQGRPDRTVRQWLADGEGSAYCDPTTHEVWVWWPDLWRKHLTTPTRQRKTA